MTTVPAVHPHVVEVTRRPPDTRDADDVDLVTVLAFSCSLGRDAACHSYPDCDCEYFDDKHHRDHPHVPHDECVYVEWFRIPEALYYEGADAGEQVYIAGQWWPVSDAPTRPHRGPVRLWAWDEGVLGWAFIDESPAASSDPGKEVSEDG